ncbi:MAG: head decoration protein [Bacilli bacterium]
MDLVNKGESYNFDNLIAGTEIPLMPIGIRMLAGQGVVRRGSILTKNSNDEYFLIATNTQTAEGILADDIDTDVETVTTMYRQGYFNRLALIHGESINEVDELARTLREINVLTTAIVE